MNDPASSFTEAYLEGLRNVHANTGNPLFLWYAIHWCLNESPRSDLPDWCQDGLAEFARRVNALSWVQPTAKSDQIPGALGFTSKGWNAFKDADSDMRKVRAYVEFTVLRKTGTPYRKALVEVMDWLGENDESNAKTIIDEGERISGVKPR